MQTILIVSALLMLAFLAGSIVGWASAHRWLCRELVKWGGKSFARRFYNEQIKRGD